MGKHTTFNFWQSNLQTLLQFVWAGFCTLQQVRQPAMHQQKLWLQPEHFGILPPHHVLALTHKCQSDPSISPSYLGLKLQCSIGFGI